MPEQFFFAKRVKEATFIKASATKIPISDGTADIVVMFDVLEHVPKSEEKDALKEANRILKKAVSWFCQHQTVIS